MYEKLAVTIARRTHEARQRAALTQEQVAESIGLPVVAYRRLERGLLLPGLPVLVGLAAVLRTSTDRLLGLEPGEATGSAP